MVEQMQQGNYHTPKLPFFFPSKRKPHVTKLLTYKLNYKNGRCVCYVPEKRTCQSFYKCEGCNRLFTAASALGGHLSSCIYKPEHYQILEHEGRFKEYSRPKQAIPGVEDDIEPLSQKQEAKMSQKGEGDEDEEFVPKK